MSENSGTGEAMVVGGGRRLVAAPDALSVEVRGGSRWIRSRVVPYDDIRAVYRYQRLDTRTLGAIAVVWLALLVLLLIAGANAHWPGGLLGLSALLLTAALAALGYFRARNTPERLLRIEAYSGVLVVPDHSPAFFQGISARIRVADTLPSAAATQHPSYGEASAASPPASPGSGV